MTWFETRTSDTGSDHYANWVTTTAPLKETLLLVTAVGKSPTFVMAFTTSNAEFELVTLSLNIKF